MHVVWGRPPVGEDRTFAVFSLSQWNDCQLIQISKTMAVLFETTVCNLCVSFINVHWTGQSNIFLVWSRLYKCHSIMSIFQCWNSPVCWFEVTTNNSRWLNLERSVWQSGQVESLVRNVFAYILVQTIQIAMVILCSTQSEAEDIVLPSICMYACMCVCMCECPLHNFANI